MGIRLFYIEYYICDVIDIDVVECSDLSLIAKLFKAHEDEPFVYLEDVQLLRVLSQLKSCKVFIAMVDNVPIGCIYAMKYMYNYGWIGGLLVHRRFRRGGVGKRLIKKALEFLKTPYTYLFVEPENIPARKLFESLGFNPIYRRLNCTFYTSSSGGYVCVNYDVGWEELTEALGFRERGGIVNLGYYPVKLTENVFYDLRRRGKVLRCGGIIAIIENSHRIILNGFSFTFNDYVLENVTVTLGESIVEVNPFYIKHKTPDFVRLLSYLATHGKVVVWTYEGDPVVSKFLSECLPGALVMEHRDILQ